MISGQWSLWDHQNDLSWLHRRQQTQYDDSNFSTLTAPHKDLELQLIYATDGIIFFFQRSIIIYKGCGSYVLALLSYARTLYFSHQWQYMNTKRRISQWNWETDSEYKYAMESIWFNTIRRSLVSVQFSQDSSISWNVKSSFVSLLNHA